MKTDSNVDSVIDESDWSCAGGVVEWFRRSRTNKTPLWIVLLIVCWGNFIATVMSSSLLIALPNIMAELNASLLSVIWVIVSYMLTYTSLTPLFGRLGDFVGRSGIYLGGYFVFCLGSLLCAAAVQTRFQAWDMMIYRIVQGVGAGMMFANVSAIIADHTPPNKLGLALGISALVSSFGLAVGPLIGGALTLVSWRWVYYINLPFGLVPAFLGVWLMRDTQKLKARLAKSTAEIAERLREFDWIGLALFVLFIITFLLALSEIAFPSIDFVAIIACFVLGGVALIGFVIFEFKGTKRPLIDPHLFLNRRFCVSQVALLLVTFSQMSILFSILLFLQGPYAKDPFTAGVLMVPYGVFLAVSGIVCGTLADRIGIKVIQVIGCFVAAGGTIGLLTCTNDTPYYTIAICQAIAGLGAGGFTSPNNRAIMAAVHMDKRGQASATTQLFGGFSRMVGIVVIFIVEFGSLPMAAIVQIFLYGATSGIDPATVALFLHGYSTQLWIATAFFIAAGLIILIVVPFDVWTTWNRYQATEAAEKEAKADGDPKTISSEMASSAAAATDSSKTSSHPEVSGTANGDMVEKDEDEESVGDSTP